MTYIEKVISDCIKRNPDEPEFIQSVKEVLETLEPVLKEHPEYEKAGLLERMVEPERAISFRVTWVDDQGRVQVNRGYRVQFNGAIGPYKGGLRFHPAVNLSTIKFLGFEQTFKNSLTTLPIGGGKGGSDFNPEGKSDGEIMRFCQAFMTELYRHIGPNVDVPAGDVGVGAREIGYLYGQYRRIRGAFENGVLTGKPLAYGGSLIRPEATGYGAIYYANEVMKHFNDTLKGKTIAISGYGNVAWGVCLKAKEMGAKVLTISGTGGYIYDPEGVSTDEKIAFLLKIRGSNDVTLEDYAKKFNAEFHPNQKAWEVQADIVMPCAIQNEVTLEDAKKIIAHKTKYYIEVSNMPTTPDAITALIEAGLVVAPSKAVNAGGVAVSALEMSQNSMRYSWTEEEVDEKLKQIMKNIHDASVKASERYHLGYNLIAGANIAGFEKVAAAMMSQGLI